MCMEVEGDRIEGGGKVRLSGGGEGGGRSVVYIVLVEIVANAKQLRGVRTEASNCRTATR